MDWRNAGCTWTALEQRRKEAEKAGLQRGQVGMAGFCGALAPIDGAHHQTLSDAHIARGKYAATHGHETVGQHPAGAKT